MVLCQCAEGVIPWGGLSSVCPLLSSPTQWMKISGMVSIPIILLICLYLYSTCLVMFPCWCLPCSSCDSSSLLMKLLSTDINLLQNYSTWFRQKNYLVRSRHQNYLIRYAHLKLLVLFVFRPQNFVVMFRVQKLFHQVLVTKPNEIVFGP